jgi:DivIVA domain-containing protein
VTGDDVRGARFRAALRGYRFSDVDQALDVVTDVLDAGMSGAVALASVTFQRALRGYSVEDVDRFLDEVRTATAPQPDLTPDSPTADATISRPLDEDYRPWDEDYRPLSERPVGVALSPGGRPLAMASATAGMPQPPSLSDITRSLLQARGVVANPADAQQIADYLLTPTIAGKDRTAEIRTRRDGGQASVVLTRSELIDAIEAARARLTAPPLSARRPDDRVAVAAVRSAIGASKWQTPSLARARR